MRNWVKFNMKLIKDTKCILCGKVPQSQELTFGRLEKVADAFHRRLYCEGCGKLTFALQEALIEAGRLER